MAVDLKLGFKLGFKPSLKLGLKPKSNWALVWNWILVSRFSFGLKLECKTLVLAKHKVTQYNSYSLEPTSTWRTNRYHLLCCLLYAEVVDIVIVDEWAFRHYYWVIEVVIYYVVVCFFSVVIHAENYARNHAANIHHIVCSDSFCGYFCRVTWVDRCYMTGMTNYPIGPHRTQSDHIGPNRTPSGPNRTPSDPYLHHFTGSHYI